MTEHTTQSAGLPDETLIVEDLMLLLLDDETGAISGAGTLHYTLGGAVLVELALRGLVELSDERAGMDGAKVRAVKREPPADPLLRSAYDRAAERPRGVQTLLIEIGASLAAPVIDRLLERGLVRRESKRVLRIFRTSTLPANDTGHEAALLERVRAVLEDGAPPDERTAAVIALLSSSGSLPSLHPAVNWSTMVYQRAKDLENGSWAAEAVNTVVSRTVAATTVGVAVAVGVGVVR